MTKPSLKILRLGIFVALMVPLLSASAQSGAVVMRIEGVDGVGDVKILGFADGNHIAVNALSLSFERDIATGTTDTTGTRAGRINPPTITLSRNIDRGSTSLMQSMFTMKIFRSIRLHFIDTTSTPTVYLSYKFETCSIQKWGSSGTGDEMPNEEIALSCSKIGAGYRARDGKTAPPVGWDFVQNVSYNPGALIAPDGKPLP